MSDARFQLAAERAASSYSALDWACLEPRARSEAVYRELRQLDADWARAHPRFRSVSPRARALAAGRIKTAA
jgi:hypothetical protein